ncbi:MAG: hypothetical protein ACRD3R_10400, partial [Terriglobales bacterium]
MKRTAWPAICAALLAAIAAAQSGDSARGIFDASGNIGIGALPGAIEREAASGRYRVTGGGANVWGREDAFYFAWKHVSGDVSITADIEFVGPGAVAHRKAMLMVRQDLTAGSAYADAALHGDGLTSLQFRSAAGAQTQEIRSEVKGPTRIRIERRGNRITLLAGKAGEPLVASGPQTLDLADPVYVGIGVCSHDAGVLETAIFSNVQVEQRTQPAPPRYRSKITIFDPARRSASVVYQADQVIEAPNWSRDGKFLLVNTGGN